MSSILTKTVFVSLLIHALLYWLFMADLQSLFNTPKPQTKTLEFELNQPQPAKVEKQPQPDIPPPPRHIEDDINKANTTDGQVSEASQQRASRQGASEAPKNKEEQPDTRQTSKLNDLEKLLQNAEAAKTQSDIEPLNEQNLPTLGKNMDSLSDDMLDDSMVENPLDKQAEERARWYNEVLKRITEQVTYAWVKPDSATPNDWGVVKLNINSEGYLQSAWVHLPSGNKALDNSVLRAVRSVIRYDIPHSKNLNRYYRHLEFHYSG
ncbi:TonB C-terminal domain-containing protein [Bermanella sp. R86510]|uniref:TonB C-terminal domain-containing protein n=1 Tax=unclassified Bermanella TaxID=2627862 RepID=UPI0037C83097